MRLVDSHTHIRRGQEEESLALAKNGLWQLVCATNPTDCGFVADLEKADEHIVGTYGLHPWYAKDFSMDAMDRWLKDAKIIGEIGLDTVWAPIPIEDQIDIFVYQLKLAVELQKPIILHTKGAESLILDYIRKYTPPRIIIHWYSGDRELLDGFIDLDCYFTLGPDIGINPIVQDVCKTVPIDRLLVETDGIEAVNWALGGEHDMESIPEVLTSSLVHGAAIKGTTVDSMSDIIFSNSMEIIRDLTRKHFKM